MGSSRSRTEARPRPRPRPRPREGDGLSRSGDAVPAMGELSSIGSTVHSGPSLCARASNRSVHLVRVGVGVKVRVRVRVRFTVGVRVG